MRPIIRIIPATALAVMLHFQSSSAHDEIIDSNAESCREHGRRVSAGSGLESKGGLNPYHPYLCPRAAPKTGSCFHEFTRDSGDVIPYASVEVDASVRFQTIEGWGASSNFYEENLLRFNPSARTELFDRVYGELGANILCIRLYSSFQSSRGGPYNWAVMAAQRMILAEALARGRINKIWLKVSSPPGWMKDNGSERNGGSVKSEHYQDYADYLSYYIRHMRRDHGIRIDAVSIFNEPGFAASHESTGTSPAEYRDILKTVAATFVRDSLNDVMLIGPEVGKISADWSYFTTILSDTAAAAVLGRLTTHQYGDQRLLYGTGPADDWEGLRDLAALHGKSVWETEMFVGGPGMATRDIDEALRVSLLLWTAVTRGDVTAWHYWQYHHPLEDGASQGIISLNPDNSSFAAHPRYYALMQWMKHVPPGAVRIKAESDNPDLHSAAFTHGDTLVCVVFNRTGTDISTGFRFPMNAGRAAHYRTSATENHAIGPEPMPGDVTTFLTVKGKSISTLVMPLLTAGTGDRRNPENFDLELFPNPTADKLTVTLRSPDTRRMTITDFLGRVMERRKIDAGEGDTGFTLDVRHWPAGPYIIGVEGWERRVGKVFVKR